MSSDFTKAEFEEHRSHLPANMLAVPYGSAEQDELKKKFKLWGGHSF